ncbi:hypothetical protein COT64_00980 [Candidatus Shapirobacteria bacterium CG09_land_8_20_14_0_10_39_12]|uniref:Uncharacterized protein n=1 Tax=Candidatus Shapirobacteria bacterium CG09_land_8_20_14_0_10_39_12 TaxID=1974885 RepID=A0A2H0WS36_9BACT|nr:MAG: hypothetical protein COT64_00980 [Candidatus Shapirobacteria bacterium CG09_land_8_20_14_0_10_39_12]
MDKNKPQSLGDILKRFDPLKDKYISKEFQKYGYDLAMELGDPEHKALYIKMAKEVPRPILEKARYFVKDAKARSRGRLFMWKVKELKSLNQKVDKKASSVLR